MKNVYTVKAFDSHDRLVMTLTFDNKGKAIDKAKQLAKIGAIAHVIGANLHVIYSI